jgi:hypothetical protein
MSVPKDPANSCSKTSGAGSSGFWALWPPFPRQRTPSITILCRSPFMAAQDDPINRSWLITAALCCCTAITATIQATQWLASKLKAARPGTCSRITFPFRMEIDKSGYIAPHDGTQWCCDSSAKQTPHALSRIRSEVLRDRHIRVKSPLRRKEEDNISATERLPSGDRGTSVGRLRPRCVRPETTSGGNGSNGRRRVSDPVYFSSRGSLAVAC